MEIACWAQTEQIPQLRLYVSHNFRHDSHLLVLQIKKTVAQNSCVGTYVHGKQKFHMAAGVVTMTKVQIVEC